jgi:hypothetical protein
MQQFFFCTIAEKKRFIHTLKAQFCVCLLQTFIIFKKGNKKLPEKKRTPFIVIYIYLFGNKQISWKSFYFQKVSVTSFGSCMALHYKINYIIF